MKQDEIRAAAESTTRSGKLTYISHHQVGPLRNLRVNYTTGDAAGQNMTGKATLAACQWIAHHPQGTRRKGPAAPQLVRTAAPANRPCARSARAFGASAIG